MTPEILAVLLFVVTFFLIFRGYPVAFCLGGTGLIFFFIGVSFDYFDTALLKIIPDRIFGIMSNNLLLAIPYFILMGNILEASGLAKDILQNISNLFQKQRGGLGITVILVGALFAAATSIVAASVVTMGVISLPLMLKQGYRKTYATGIILASGTLGQIIPPSIVLIVLADQVGVSVGDLFKGALIPGLLLVSFYLIYTLVLSKAKPNYLPIPPSNAQNSQNDSQLWKNVLTAALPPLLLIVLVLGSIFLGVATVAESGSIGVLGTVLLSFYKKNLTKQMLFECAKKTVVNLGMILFLLIGATIFSLVFRALDGDILLEELLSNLPGGKLGMILFSGILIFFLGFFIDFFEIIFIIVPLLIPVAERLGINLVWFSIIISMNLQTSFLTPPFGFSIFFLKSVCPSEIKTQDLYRGVIPFILLQVLCMVLVYLFPSMVTT